MGFAKAPLSPHRNMNIQTIAEHSVAMDLLRPGSYILDAGCRWMEFHDELTRLGHYVYALDCDKLSRADYHRIALSDHNGWVGVKRTKDVQATTICNGDEVRCSTIKDLSLLFGVPFWDLIKLDIEGSEYDVVMSLDKAPAKQLSIEFHLHTGAYNMAALKSMEMKLNRLGYYQARHEMTSQHGCGLNYWDSLFILR